jgi:hypothetical protein
MQGEDTLVINTVKLVFDVMIFSFVENDKFCWKMKCYLSIQAPVEYDMIQSSLSISLFQLLHFVYILVKKGNVTPNFL